MAWAFAVKELRETAWIWILAAACFFIVAMDAVRVPLVPGIGMLLMSTQGQIPFVEIQIAIRIAGVMGLFGIALGIRQTAGEMRSGTYPLTLHLPMSRRRLFAVKLVTGIGLVWILGGVALAAICWWAATPGTHASPFEWSMTADAWRTWFAMPIVYLGAFTTGVLPARWFGTRLFPLVTACLATMMLLMAGQASSSSIPFVFAVLGTACAYLVILDHLVAVRDFS